MTNASLSPRWPEGKQWPLALIRIVIGWHFLYEGVSKLIYPGWTAEGYLKSSSGPVAALFHWMGSQAPVVGMVNILNMWGLLLIGLALMLGVAVRAAAWSGIGLLALYYLAHPPLFAPQSQSFQEGTYLLVNKNLVELCALLVVAFYPTAQLGLGALWPRLKILPQAEPASDKPKLDLATQHLGPIPRRRLFASLAGVPVLGAFVLAALKKHGWKSVEEAQLLRRTSGKDSYTASATLKTFQFTSRSDLKGRLPYGRIGNLTLSRMILGGNLIGGWAHARDLIYVSKLVRAYHHRDKIFETLALAESCGVNAIITNPLLCNVINDYWRHGGKIQFISDCGGKDVLQLIQKSIDAGAAACYVQGGVGDRLVEEGQFDLIARSLELIRRNGLPAGMGGHKLATIQACVDRGIRPDFWMKTLHRLNYWSAKPDPEHDNRWCEDPDETAAYMKDLPEPWIAFKILAAGAIKPQDAFQYAFEQGADFICVGMYDFQIIDDVNLAASVLSKGVVRARQWRA